jgi:hypothetical protein
MFARRGSRAHWRVVGDRADHYDHFVLVLFVRRLTRFRSDFPSEPMRVWPISTRVNKPENDDPSIVEPIALKVSAA